MNYFDFGWYVFPCNGKVPATPHGFKDAVNNQEDYNALYQKCPGNNFGVVTGDKSGFFCLDIDIKNGSKGAESFSEMVAKHGQFPPTVESKTWSGGRHLLFKMPKHGIGNRTNFMPGIDIRGNGGYIVVPPSSIEGKSYEWVKAPNTVPMADAPAWLLEVLKTEVPVAPTSTKGIPQGARNSELASRAGMMRKSGMPMEHILPALLFINSTECQPPLPEKEVRVIAESISRYEPAPADAPLTDLWNSDQFVAKYGENLRWCDPLGGWFVWDGTVWTNKDDTYVMRLVKEYVRNLGQRADATSDKKLKSWAVKSQSSGKMEAIIKLSRSSAILDEKVVDEGELLLNCANGTLNLKTMELRPHRREDYLTKKMSVPYIPTAECPTWERFLMETFQGDKDLINYVQRTIGYCLTGSVAEQKFFLCIGNGQNGKNTFIEAIMNILSTDYATRTPARTMLESEGNTLNAIAALKSKRLVVLDEFDEGQVMSSAQVKNLTGGDTVIGRFLYHEQFIYKPTYKFWLTTNHKPRIKDTSMGIWRRLVVLPFDHTVPREKRDNDLKDKLAAEYDGIFAWAVRGYQDWRVRGLDLDMKKLEDAVAIYKEDSDMIGQFMAENNDIEVEVDKAEVTVVEFIKAFQSWCVENGIKYYPGRGIILDYLSKRGYGRPVKGTNAVNKGRMVIKGLAICKRYTATPYG